MKAKSNSKEKLKHNSKGITLIALVVTIVVTLILVAVTLGLALDEDDGIITDTKNSIREFNNLQNETNEQINGLLNELENSSD